MNSAVEAQAVAFKAWIAAAERAGSVSPEKVIDAAVGISVPNLTGGNSAVLKNHHISKPIFIGKIRADGQFNVIWQSKTPIAAEAWSPYLGR